MSPFLDRLQTVQAADERALAGAGGPADDQHLALLDLLRNTFEHMELAIPFMDSLISISDIISSFLVDFHPGRGAALLAADSSLPGIPFQHNRNSMNREAAIAPYSSLCYRFCTSFEPKPQEIVMALFTKEESLAYHEEPRPGSLKSFP